MSDYSSFEKDKKIFDNWRSFLNESVAPGMAELEEFVVGPVNKKDDELEEQELEKKPVKRVEEFPPPPPPESSTQGNIVGASEKSMEDAHAKRLADEKRQKELYGPGKKPTASAADSPGPDWTRTITDLGGILDTGVEGITSQKRKDKPHAIHTVYRDVKGNPFLADTDGFLAGSAPLPDPGTGEGIWNANNTLTKQGQRVLSSWLKANPGYSNMLAKARVNKKYDLDKYMNQLQKAR